MTHYRILIVGAGLAGLSLARALRQAGLAPQVIEREPGRGVAGTGIYLPANGVRALRTLLWLRTRLTPWTTLQGHPTQTFM